MDHPSNTLKRRRADGDGLKAAWPICLGYIPIGLAFGVLAKNEGLGPLQVGIMSLLVFAGSAQFVAVGMLSQAVPAPSIIVAVFMINLRHVLMSSVLASYMRGKGKAFLSIFAYGITDESFAVNLIRFRGGGWSPYQALVVNQAANTAWIVSTIVGAVAGEFVPSGAFGIDYALPAMFLCLLVFQLNGRLYVATAVMAGMLAVIFRLLIPGGGYIMPASVTAATLGSMLRRISRKRMAG